jgi:hypothetical protein
MMQLSEAKARESGRWDKRVQNMDDAINLFQVRAHLFRLIFISRQVYSQIDIAINYYRKESWLYLASCLLGKVEAILNSGPHFLHDEFETTITSIGVRPKENIGNTIFEFLY